MCVDACLLCSMLRNFFLENLLKRKIVCTFANRKKDNRFMAYSNSDKLEWTLIFALEFGKRYGLTMKQAFNYLSRYKGIDFIDRHYDYVHTQSFKSMVSDIAELCHRKGGELI